MHRFLRKPGYQAFVNVAVGLLVATQSSCLYRLTAGGGFPSDVKTIYIQTFENETAQFDLDQQLFRKLQEKVPGALGVQRASEDKADAWITGKIVRYEDAAQNYRPGDTQSGVQVLQHQVQLTISIQIINRKTNTILWDSQGLTGRGEYNPTNQTDVVGREQALNNIIQQIIDGAQSQW